MRLPCGHREEDGESQQMVLSWAEFMAEEPVKPKRRNWKTQPTTMSMFGVGRWNWSGNERMGRLA